MLSKTDPDPDGTGPQPATVTNYQYNAYGLNTITDGLSHVTTFGRDGQVVLRW